MKLTLGQLRQLINNSRLSHDGEDLYGFCPKCGHDEFGISVTKENNPFSCFRKSKCGFVGNAYTLLTFLNRRKEFLTDREINVFESELNSLVDRKEIETIMLPEIKPPVLWKRIYEDAYLTSRGFTGSQFQKFKVGRSTIDRDYITFMVEMNGLMTGYVSRSERSKAWIDNYNEKAKDEGRKDKYLRYRNSHSDFDRMLFGYDEIIESETTDVVLVEGIFSKTKTDTNLGLDYDNRLKCVATFGAKVSEEQIRLLKVRGVKNIWLWFEADVLNKVKEIAAKLSLHFDVKVCFLNGFDPGDIERKEAQELFENSVSFLEIDVNYLS